MYVKEVQCDDMAWINLAEDEDRWLSVVNTAMNLRISYTSGSACVAERLLVPQECLLFVELVFHNHQHSVRLEFLMEIKYLVTLQLVCFLLSSLISLLCPVFALNTVTELTGCCYVSI
jgi:hypothetical protein